MWFNAGSEARMSVSVPAGPILVDSLAMLAIRASISPDHEVLRYTWEVTDPETGEVTTGAARLVIEPLPDPREGEA